MGEGESVATERPFHSIKAVERMRAKLRTWVRIWRGCMVPRENMMAVEGGWDEGFGGDPQESLLGM